MAGIDVVLVGCVKSKVDHPAPARDLYTLALFRKERAYAEAAGVPWFILSAEYGLVDPDEIVEPYERYLPSMPAAYRREWGSRVVEQLSHQFDDLDGTVIEVHAGATYLKAIRDGLEGAGATALDPLVGLSIGRRLAWYPSLVKP